MSEKYADATLSPCGKYRHHLVRRVDDKNDKILTFIMLNPSTADATMDDPTIRKCKGFCERLGYSVLSVVNLFDYRATDPKQLKLVSEPCSKHNLGCIRATAIMSDKVICAWGIGGTFGRQNEKILELMAKEKIPAYALDITKDGHPKHPLYIGYDKTPVIFREAQP